MLARVFFRSLFHVHWCKYNEQMLQLKYLFDAYVNKFTESDGTQTHIHTHKAQTNKWKMMEMLIKSYFQGLSERVESNGVKSQDE